jgi:Uroporphyrinogen decarboxylase (URO-D)
MTSRERILAALNHEQPDRVPVDLGSGPTTGMAASTVHRLKVALGLAGPDDPVKVIEPFQMLGEIDASLREALGLDVVGVHSRTTFFGFDTGAWKPWRLFDGTPVLVPEKFNTEPEPGTGDILQYPQGDRSCGPSARMPNGGFYFDAIVRQKPIVEDELKVEDNLEEFGVLSGDALEFARDEAARLRETTDSAVMVLGPGTAFGDIAHVPATRLKDPKGIRDIEEWYVSLMIRREFIREVFLRQSEIAIRNLELLWAAVGERADIIYMSGTDFGTQNGPFCSPKDYCDLWQPVQRKLNDWVHEHTTWKTFMHCCGSIVPLLDPIIDAGFDILNPVQTTAAGMDPCELKERFGRRIVFWGGGIDTQRTLPFGTPEEVRNEVRQRLEIFAPGGGFVFNTIHNVQADVPAENLIALFDTVRELGR